ncbi:hypothetical protein SNE40_019658 [Patella caerulea]|uniref:Uncharacterized protein n=1 Tax=Patella caerulea TaxID=87958 RepID=A0AAN8J7V6_PATCE
MSRERSTHICEGCMVYEWLRFATFANWSSYNHARPITLAASGFYYTGNHEIVRCYSCGVEKGQWSVTSNPMAEHRQLNPWCLHLNGEDMRNVPVYSATQNHSAFPIYRQRNPSPLLHHQCTSDVFYSGRVTLQTTAENLHITEKRQPTPANHVYHPEFMDARQCTSSIRVCNCIDDFNLRCGGDRRNTHLDQNSVVEEYDEGRHASNRRNCVMCCICNDRPPEVQFLPCCHLICCGVCADTVRSCVICRTIIRETIPAGVDSH